MSHDTPPGSEPPFDPGSGPGSYPAPEGYPPAGSYPPPAGTPPPGSFPPPPDGYGQPPSYPPPPGGGYGAPPQGGGGYGPPPTYGSAPIGGLQRPYSLGEAFNYGWTKLQANFGSIVLGLLGYFVAFAVISVIWFFIVGALAPTTNDDGSSAGFAARLISSALFSLVATGLGYVVQAGIVRGALAITYGRKIEMKTLFSTDQIVPILIGSVIVAVASAVGFFLCFIPGLIVAFFSQFFIFFIIDKKMQPVDAIKASFSFVNKNLASLIGFYLVSVIAIVIGAVLCGIGLLVAFPVVVIAQAYTYRQLQGEQVAA